MRGMGWDYEGLKTTEGRSGWCRGVRDTKGDTEEAISDVEG